MKQRQTKKKKSFKFLQPDYWVFSVRKYIKLNFPQLFRIFTSCFILFHFYFFLLAVINFFWCQVKCWRRINKFELTAIYWSLPLFLNFYLSKGKKKKGRNIGNKLKRGGHDFSLLVLFLSKGSSNKIFPAKAVSDDANQRVFLPCLWKQTSDCWVWRTEETNPLSTSEQAQMEGNFNLDSFLFSVLFDAQLYTRTSLRG